MKKLLSLGLALMLCLGLTASAAAPKEDVSIIKYDGVEYGKVTLSGLIADGKTTFNIEGESLNWSYSDVAANSTCTIEPYDFGGHLYLTLESYVLSNGVYTTDLGDDSLGFTVLWGDGKSLVGFGNPPYSDPEFQPYFPKPGHPASFVFGKNEGTMPLYGDSYSYNLRANGNLYVMRCEIYDKDGVFVRRYSYPFFIKDEQAVTPPATVGTFTDVLADAYYGDAVKWAVDKKVTSGTSATTFSPDTTCTNSQILTFLWRAAGSLEPTKPNPYNDVSDSDYYAKAARWAHEKGLVSGSSFMGNTPATRSMTVTYLWQLAGSPKATGSAFTDVPSDANYAQAVAWAVDQGITSGTSATTFSPDTICSRGQIVTFLHRYFSK